MGIQLGDKCRDKITGFEGVAVARTRYLTGCDRISLEGPNIVGMKPEDNWRSFDEQRLEVTSPGYVKINQPDPLPAGSGPG